MATHTFFNKFNMEETFFTRVGCMDGRVLGPVSRFGKEKFHAEYPDTIAEAGEVGILAHNPPGDVLFNLKQELDVSIDKHRSRGVVVHGHEDCAANPVDEVLHIEDIRKSVEVVRDLVHGKVPVVGVFVRRATDSTNDWMVEEIEE